MISLFDLIVSTKYKNNINLKICDNENMKVYLQEKTITQTRFAAL